ncbi:hypothetical protein G0029_17115 (plasmid) [Acinetobacter sp. YH12138]|uniref:hypothetical protein n=1 Tax=unclassified Acinetobacter TaxID=196816 RepID=UPI0015D24201|nr:MULTISPECIES: hypothetical protein [unclassified Acinetobacter]QOW51489.1 hypothetical protein G0029_17115 [Acinetobacter sp. YH12138]
MQQSLYELKVECGRAKQNKYNKKNLLIDGKWVAEDEWLIPGYIRPSEIVGKKKV